MKQTALFIGFFLILAPSLVFAQALPTCSAQGYTVIFVNGIFDTYQQALDDSTALNQKIGFSYREQPLKVQLGYNPTHIAGLGDDVDVFVQQFNSSLSDFDLDTILMQIYPEVTTRKLLVVGHSQGAEYANEMYSYLLAHGEPKEAVGVYAVATPANFVAGGGKYVTSTTDKVMSYVIAAAAIALEDGVHVPQPLPANISIALSPASTANNIGGHSFSDDYLAGAGPRITNDIDGELDALIPTDASAKGDCFTPPDASVGYKTQQVLFAVADPTAVVLKAGTVTTLEAGVVAFNTVKTLAVGLGQLVADAVTLSAAPPSDAQATTKTDTVINKLYGSSLDGLSTQDKKELLGNSQGGAVALAAPQETGGSGVVLGTSTEIVPTTTPSAPPSIFPSSSNGPIVGGGGGGSSPAPVIAIADDTSATVVDDSTGSADTTDNATTTEDTDASTTPPVQDEAPSTPPDDASTTLPVPPAPPTGAPVRDNFDSYTADNASSAWSVWPNPNNSFIHFGADDGSGDTYGNTRISTSTDDCHSGGCIIATGMEGGLGGGGTAAIMYKESGIGQDSGAFTIWARARTGWRDATASVGLCAGVSLGCSNSNVQWLDPLGTSDNIWHQYYVAWRQGDASVEVCVLQDDTNGTDCPSLWKPTNLSLGTQIDGILLAGGVIRPDLGDQVWFDDLGE